MTTKQHVILYNIGMTLVHGGNTGNKHLCPNKRNYEYFVYWDMISEKRTSRFGDAVDSNKIQVKRQTGEEQVLLTKAPCICKTYTAEKRVVMVDPSLHKKKKCAEAVKELETLETGIGESVKRTAIEKTLVLQEYNANWKIPIIDFVDVFDSAALFAHFKSLFRCFLEEIILGNNGRDVINRLKNLFRNWEQIFNERECVLEHILSYMNLAVMGIEKTDSQLYDLSYLMQQSRIDLNEKKNAKDCLSFLLPDNICREQFQECITVLSAFLKTYAEDESKDLLLYIKKYENTNLQINRIRTLGKVNMHLLNAKIANAKIIKKYLGDPLKYGGGAMFVCVA